jgi:hypothetical protein
MSNTIRRLPASPISPNKKSFELMPVSLLPYRKTWQPLMRSLPANACLIVTRLDRNPSNLSMSRLVSSLRRQGQKVYLLCVG